MLRSPIGELVSSIRTGKVKYKELEMAFSRDLDEARSSVKVTPSKLEDQKNERPDERTEQLLRLASTDPRSAVLKVWIFVEAAAARTATALAPKLSARRINSPAQLSRTLRGIDGISAEIVDAYEKLRDLRNRTSHVPEFQPSVSDAEDFILLALAVEHDLLQAQTT